MGEYDIGQFIYRSRKALAMTQEELCECEDGMMCCSVETLSRVERGKQRPNYRTMRELLKHLGKENCFCGSYLKTDSYKLLEVNRELKRAIAVNEFERAEQLLGDLEKELSLEYATNRQYLIRTHALLDRVFGRITVEESLELMEKALRLTVRSYGTKYFFYEVLMPQEITIVCNIANSYGSLGNIDKALELVKIVHDMLHDETMQKRYPDHLIALVERIYVKWAGEKKKYIDAIVHCNRSIKHWTKNGTANTLPGLYYARAYNLQALKETSSDWSHYDQGKINFDLEMSIQLSELYRTEYIKISALKKLK